MLRGVLRLIFFLVSQLGTVFIVDTYNICWHLVISWAIPMLDDVAYPQIWNYCYFKWIYHCSCLDSVYTILL